MLAMTFGDDSTDDSSGGGVISWISNLTQAVGTDATQAVNAVTSSSGNYINSAVQQANATASQGSSFSSILNSIGGFVGNLVKGALSTPTTPIPGVATTYPAGSITAFDPSMGRWRVGIPGSAGVGVADAYSKRCLYGNCGGPGLGASYHEVAPVLTAPPGVSQVALATFLTDTGQGPFYTQMWFWLAVGGAVVVGGGAYLVLRRRREAV